jgi:two-component system, LytTR family, sensor kinase
LAAGLCLPPYFLTFSWQIYSFCKTNFPLVTLNSPLAGRLTSFDMMKNNYKQYWIFQAVGWGSVGLINLFFAYIFDRLESAKSREDFFIRIGVFIVLGPLLTHIARLITLKLGILQKSLEKQILQFVIVTLCLSFVTSFIFMEVVTKYDALSKSEKDILNNEDKSYLISRFSLLLNSAFYFFVYYFIWNLIYFVYHYVAKSRKQQLNTFKLESLVKELELKTIKSHINPHFIFNSLNSIRALIDENPGRARNAVTELSNILRSSMQSDKMETVNLERELNIVKDYLALENMRFEDRLKVEYSIDEDTLDQPVPPMMLQTLVENAIKHGISKQIDGGVVKVISDFKGDFHELVVQNTGQLNGYTSTEGFGLSSTVNRLNLLYGEKASFEIKQLDPALVEAKVLIPVVL